MGSHKMTYSTDSLDRYKMRILIFLTMLIFLCWATIIAAADQQIIQSKTSIKFTRTSDFYTYEVIVKGTKGLAKTTIATMNNIAQGCE